MSLNSTRKTATVVALIGLAALFAGVFLFQHIQFKKEIDPNTFHGTYLKQPRPVSTFELTGTDGQTFDNEHLKGQWTMVFFGFTNCGYVCPTTMAELGKTYRLILEKKIHPAPRVVMISIDPARDNLEKLKNYVLSFDKRFYGARGSQAKIKHMTREMGVVYTKVLPKQGKPAENYDIQHSGAIIVFNPKGELNAFFTAPHDAEAIAEDYRKLVS
ncbi:SCO family protein [Legionella sp. W05-934-2]|jgi:protein SCO1/2|uniref:SCO family protein n=1 Tax=Legionella sp. W05-934-2 TaxID=1198649 RepID=UPI003462E657